MTIASDGWLEGASVWKGHPEKVNGGVNRIQGVVYHSAEGYATALLNSVVDVNRRASWHFSNMKDGRLWQHYPVTAQCWTSGAGFPNNSFVTVENEGVVGQPLAPAQVANLIMLTREISAFGRRSQVHRIVPGELVAPAGVFLLVEHNECTRWGAFATACPSGRIPWQAILDSLGDDDMALIEEYKAAMSYHIAKSYLIAAVMNDFKIVPVGETETSLTVEFHPADGRPSMATLEIFKYDIPRYGK